MTRPRTEAMTETFEPLLLQVVGLLGFIIYISAFSAAYLPLPQWMSTGTTKAAIFRLGSAPGFGRAGTGADNDKRLEQLPWPSITRTGSLKPNV